MDWLTYASIPLVVFTMWLFTAHEVSTRFPTLRNKRIVLLIAHPDDEAMFFAPTVIALTKPELNNQFSILCLSSGNADGLGEIRKKELKKSALHLGLRSPNDVTIIDSPDFPDSITTTWSTKSITTLLSNTYLHPTKPSSAPSTSIDILITFDAHGISGHPNHKSLHTAATSFITELAAKHRGWEVPIKLYSLRTVSVVRKYLSILDAPVTLVGLLVGAKKEKGEAPTPLVYMSGFGGYTQARRAMTEAHRSQMVWFRWGWIGTSRYMVLNDLRKEGR
ncbi:LmbE-like protein [Microthyrium microscopicum]|uniref:N-acetylglucosaminylphosphatidylinositol deacetylase n=1 Tax=Microthyrium microscopicum TaxID=703497 RepID=A0A6A6U0T0_9PEZI|nr:LmbE-like protein [Microthyrium microscopicum]